MYSIRNIEEKDAPLLRYLAKRCQPLDVHTHYTYWVVSNYFGSGGFILEADNAPAGYIMTVDTPSAVFVWQIGLLEAHRGKGLSQQLIAAAASYAKSVAKNMEVTISADNKASYSAFSQFCKKNQIRFERIGNVDIPDMDDPSFCEAEIAYRLHIPSAD